jgi:hypothetical protein
MRSLSIGRRAALHALAVAGVTLLACQAPAGAAESSQPGAPGVHSGGVSHGTATTAVLNGRIDPHALATTYYFQYGPTVAYGSQTATASLAAGTTAIKVHQTVRGMSTGYHYRLVAMNADGTRYGHDRTFIPKVKTKTVEVGFTLPKTFQPTPFGGMFTLSGTLKGTGNANRAVVLQASPYPYRTPFAAVGAPVMTSAGGGFFFHVIRMSISTKFRVATVEPPIHYSPVVPERVAVRVTLKARRRAHTNLVRLYGTVTPAEAGARVLFQLRKPASAKQSPRSERPIKLEKPEKERSEEAEERREAPRFSTKFSTVVKHGTRTTSRFSTVVRLRDTGRYRAFAQVHPGPVSSGHSASIMLHAAPTTKHKKGPKA